MGNSLTKALFFVDLSVIGAILALGVTQVPQPWRGVLVGWLFIGVTIGGFVLRILKHHYDYKSLKLTSKHPPIRKDGSRRQSHSADKRFEGLRVVRSRTGSGSRHVIK